MGITEERAILLSLSIELLTFDGLPCGRLILIYLLVKGIYRCKICGDEKWIENTGIRIFENVSRRNIYRSWFLGYVDKTVVGAALSK